MALVLLLLGAQAQTWTFTGSMGAPRAFFTATVLNKGHVGP